MSAPSLRLVPSPEIDTEVTTGLSEADLGPRIDRRILDILHERAARLPLPPTEYAHLWQQISGATSGGKKFRPLILVRLHRALGSDDTDRALNPDDTVDTRGGIDDGNVIDTACAIEILHTALITHDDVIDRDMMRRGSPTLTEHFRRRALDQGADPESADHWGDSSAILAGDLLLTAAQSVISRLRCDPDTRVRLLDAFDSALVISAAGEHEDVRLSMGLHPANVADVLTATEQKTSPYSFQLPMTCAALLAGCTADTIETISQIARHIGIVYQLRDDIIGVFGRASTSGKSTISDLREGKETALIQHARSDAAWENVSSLFGDHTLTESGASQLRDAISRSGARELVEALIYDHRARAEHLIGESTLPPTAQDFLRDLVTSSDTREG